MSDTPSDTSLTRFEIDALELIIAEKGVYQSDLWKELNLNSTKGSDIARSLESNGFIDRDPATHNGNATYHLTSLVEETDIDELARNTATNPFGTVVYDPQYEELEEMFPEVVADTVASLIRMDNVIAIDSNEIKVYVGEEQRSIYVDEDGYALVNDENEFVRMPSIRMAVHELLGRRSIF